MRPHLDLAQSGRAKPDRPGPAVAAALLACMLAAGCASGGPPPEPAASVPAAAIPAAREQGARLAAQICAACHAVGPSGDSTSPMAPPFRNLRLRYNPISLERHIADIAKSGVYAMPAQPLTPSDAEAIAAYIEWLRPAS